MYSASCDIESNCCKESSSSGLDKVTSPLPRAPPQRPQQSPGQDRGEVEEGSGASNDSRVSNGSSVSNDSGIPSKKRCWKGPAKTRIFVNGLSFRSDFDSGNLMKVSPVQDKDNNVGMVYELWTARDCEGGPNTRRNSSWFYFGVAGAKANQTITLRLMNLNNQSVLYKYGMTPVFRHSGSPVWARLRQKVKFEEDERHLRLQFQFRFTRDQEEVFFAFCFPHSYEDCQRDLQRCEEKARRDGMAVQSSMVSESSSSTAYYHRELLILTPEGRRVDLLTVTDCHGILEEREPRIDPHLFPDPQSGSRPFEFSGKDVVFVSARVHPGETPSSFVFQGILRFLLDSADSRAAELRRRFIFKLVPLLNPDGVAAGHFRQDSYGNNLNRHYGDPHPERHASVYASKAVVMHHAARPPGRGRLTLYLDLHAHASTRGCFVYGNHLPSLEDQAENLLLPLLMTIYTPHFDFASCNFSLKHMSRVDSGDGGLSAEGTGRVFYGKRAGVLRSYTLECNYNTGKQAMRNYIPPAHGTKDGELSSPEQKPGPAPRYNPQTWRHVGQGFLKALLDADGASVWSRLPRSRFRSLEGARRFLVNGLRSQPSYREQSLLLRRGTSCASTPPLPPPPRKAPDCVTRSPSRLLSSANVRTPPLLETKTRENAIITGDFSNVDDPAQTRQKNAREVSHPLRYLLPIRSRKTSPPRGHRRAISREAGAGKVATPWLRTTSGDAPPPFRSRSRRIHRAVATPTCAEGNSTSRNGKRRSVVTATVRRATSSQATHQTQRSVSRGSGDRKPSGRRRTPKNVSRSIAGDNGLRGRQGSTPLGRKTASRSGSRSRSGNKSRKIKRVVIVAPCSGPPPEISACVPPASDEDRADSIEGMSRLEAARSVDRRFDERWPSTVCRPEAGYSLGARITRLGDTLQ